MWTFVLAHGKCEDRVTCSVAHVKSEDMFFFIFQSRHVLTMSSNTAVEHFLFDNVVPTHLF